MNLQRLIILTLDMALMWWLGIDVDLEDGRSWRLDLGILIFLDTWQSNDGWFGCSFESSYLNEDRTHECELCYGLCCQCVNEWYPRIIHSSARTEEVCLPPPPTAPALRDCPVMAIQFRLKLLHQMNLTAGLLNGGIQDERFLHCNFSSSQELIRPL